jgi:hypothetical protein
MYRPKYKFVEFATGKILTFGDDNTQTFGGPWGELQAEGKAGWVDNVQTATEIKNEESKALFSVYGNYINQLAIDWAVASIQLKLGVGNQDVVDSIETEMSTQLTNFVNDYTGVNNE